MKKYKSGGRLLCLTSKQSTVIQRLTANIALSFGDMKIFRGEREHILDYCDWNFPA